MFLNMFLMAQLSENGWTLFGWWTLAVVSIYLVYSLPASWVHDEKRVRRPQDGGASSNSSKYLEAGGGGEGTREAMKEVEMAEGQGRPIAVAASPA